MKKELCAFMMMCAISSFGVTVDIVPVGDAEAGKPVEVQISVVGDNGEPISGGAVKVTAGNEFGGTVFEKSVDYEAPFTVGFEFGQPGFASVKAVHSLNGNETSVWKMVPVDALKIAPGTPEPEDFREFWAANLRELTDVGLDPQVNGNAISFANVDGTRVHGYISTPSKPGKYPALLTIPGAGPGTAGPVEKHLAEKAIILVLNVHPYEVETTTAQARYDQLNADGMYMYHGMPNRDGYYFRRAILGITQGVRYIEQLDQWNGKELVVWGSSQGGWMSLATTALNPSVSAAAVNVPAGSDFLAYKRNGSPGWPFGDRSRTAKPEDAEMVVYFDNVNFAPLIKCPVMIVAGWKDTLCPPGAAYAMYNRLGGEKIMLDAPETAHEYITPHSNALAAWIEAQLLK